MRSFFDGIYAVLSQNLFCCNLRCFVAKPVLSRFTHFLCGDKSRPKCCPWRKNDIYHVWYLLSYRFSICVVLNLNLLLYLSAVQMRDAAWCSSVFVFMYEFVCISLLVYLSAAVYTAAAWLRFVFVFMHELLYVCILLY